MDGPTRGVTSGDVISEDGAACQAVVDDLASGGGRRASVWLEHRGDLRRVAVSGPDLDASSGSEGIAGPAGSLLPGAAMTNGMNTPTGGAAGLAATDRTDQAGGGGSAGLRLATERPDGVIRAERAARHGGRAPAPVVRSAFEAGIETLIPDLASAAADPEQHGDEAAGFHGRACLPIASADTVAGVLDVLLEDPIGPSDLHSFREAAAELGRRLRPPAAAQSRPPAQRVLRHVARLTLLQEPDDIARIALTAALELTGFDEGAILRRTPEGRLQTLAAVGPFAAALRAGAPDALEAVVAESGGSARITIGLGAGPAAPIGGAGPAISGDGAAAAAPTGPPGPAVAGGGDAAATADPPLVPRALAAAGVEALLSIGLDAEGAPPAVLLLAGAPSAVPEPDELEILEALAANVAGCLRTAELLECLRRRAATDPLTGLGHHASFHETLAASHRRPRTAVVLIDVDDFKRFNDTFGHQHGDQVLRGVADALSGALRRGDSLFRIGGDEFAALLAVSTDGEAREAGQRLRAAVARAGLGVTLSIGVAVPHDEEGDAAVLARADQALYRVKARGRDGVELAPAETLPVAPPL